MDLDNIINEKRVKKLQIIRLIGSLVSVVLLIYLLYVQGSDEIIEAVNRVTSKSILLAFLLVMLSRFVTSARWHMILKGLDIQIPFLKTLSLTFAGLFAANFMPTTVGGDIARLIGTVRMGHDGVKCTASLVLDRVIGMLGMLFAVPFGLHQFTSFKAVPLLSSLIILSTIIGNKKFRPLFSWTYKSVIGILNALKQGVKQPKCMFGALVFTLFHMIFLFGSMTILLSGMDKDVPFLLIAGLWSIVYLLTLLPISINGYGVQELSATYIFTHAAGLTPTTAVTIVILVRVLTVIATIPGAFCLPSLAINKRE
jgi:uncharacterized protein (TIRG00374 family)